LRMIIVGVFRILNCCSKPCSDGCYGCIRDVLLFANFSVFIILCSEFVLRSHKIVFSGLPNIRKCDVSVTCKKLNLLLFLVILLLKCFFLIKKVFG